LNQEKIKQWAGIGYVNLATLAWASNMVIGRMVREEIGPLTLSAARFSIAALFFYLLLRNQAQPSTRPTGKALWLMVGMALSGVILFSPLLYLGLHYTTAINGTLINGTGPLLTGLLAAVLIREPMTGRQIGGAAVALAGVLYLISGGSLSFWQQAQYNIGDLLVLAAVSTWGLYSILSSRAMRLMPAISASAWSIYIGLPVLCLLAAWELYLTPIELNLRLIAILVYLGIGPAAIGFYAWNQGVSRLGASGAMVFYNTLPLYGAILASLSLGEPIGSNHIIGGLLIIGGGLWSARKK
jgi:drug/metabolite transporter (DMT)-like permease